MSPDAKALLEAALKISEQAYAPYSDFAVGAALLGANGITYSGCNIENASYGLTICAERVAMGCAIADGCREFTALALAGGDNRAITPCGACLQVLSEFCSPEMPIYSAPQKGIPLELKLSDCLPLTFGAADIKG